MRVKAFCRGLMIGIVFCLSAQDCDAQNVPSAHVAAKRARITGTFSSLRYHDESGDVLGTEVRIVAGRHGFQATIQVAEGSPSNLVLVPTVEATPDGRIRFVLPPNDLTLKSFDGVVSDADLSGTWTYSDGRTERIHLKRGESYWK